MHTQHAVSKRPESVLARTGLWLYAILIDFVTSALHVLRYLFWARPSEDSQDVLNRGLALIGLLMFFGFGIYGYVTALVRHQGSILLMTIVGWSVIALLYSGVRRYREIMDGSND